MQIFGFDFVVDSEGQALLLEANMAPQFGDPQAMPDLRERVALPMINSIPHVVTHAISGDTSCDLIFNTSDGAPQHPWSCWEVVPLPSLGVDVEPTLGVDV